MEPPNERTALIQVVRVAPARRRYTHRLLRRACSVALGSLLAVAVILFLLPEELLPRPRHFGRDHRHRHRHRKHGLPFEELQDILLSTPSEERAQEWSAYYTSGPHLAGKNYSQAEWTQNKWKDFGIDDTSIVSYDVYLNYPIGHRLALLEKTDAGESTADDWRVTYEARLEEDVLDEDDTSGLSDRIPTFHGYSASGNVTAQYVYANYGTYGDFEDLQKANISLVGKIALLRYGHVFRGLKVKRAQELGMVGVIIYSDPGDDGDLTVEEGVPAYPKGPAREPSSVQRGSTQFLSILAGDPTTPGYPSKPGVPRTSPDIATPTIPSLPISYEDALPLLTALNGHGPPASSFSDFWDGGGLGYLGVQYHIGPSPSTLALNLMNDQEYVITPIWNVIGIINGSASDEVVILGNHRDAWTASGAGDPHSGSAELNEVVRSFGKALEQGWKPLRTIVFCSWDGEEYGLLGSTEWVEEYIPWLSESAVAYINVDIGTVGPRFSAAASPILNQLLYDVTSIVPSPNVSIEGQTVRDTWDGHIRTMGSGSDFTAFQDFAGIPCLDMSFKNGPQDALHHYHSNYDSFDWMDRFGDPGWHYHATMAKIFALVGAKLADMPVVPFGAADYSRALITYVESAKGDLLDDDEKKDERKLSFASLDDALQGLLRAAVRLDGSAAALTGRLHRHVPWWKWWKKAKLYHNIVTVNDKYIGLERQFLHFEGLDGRPWFKHVVFAPGLWTGYSGSTFPGIVESIERKDWVNAQRWIGIVETRVQAATLYIK
ncbi:MAG: hypothetical protein M1815_000387 [Lichina confinis]|nr:MAG: hypothetical protein M1815_000387 [Lichina confinis]